VYEGGTRTPFITRWKGRIQPGVSDAIVCTVDLAASFAALTGQPVPDDACLDSLNVMDALLGVAGSRGRDHLLQQDNVGRSKGLRQGQWKLVQGTGGEKVQLFDLASDPGEKVNLAGTNPEKLKSMRSLLAGIVDAGRTRAVAAGGKGEGSR
jgi:arylsulfatase A